MWIPAWQIHALTAVLHPSGQALKPLAILRGYALALHASCDAPVRPCVSVRFPHLESIEAIKHRPHEGGSWRRWIKRRQSSGRAGGSMAPNSRRWYWNKSARRGASAAGVALSHGLNPNMVRRWMREDRQRQMLATLRESNAFVPLHGCPFVFDAIFRDSYPQYSCGFRFPAGAHKKSP